MSGRGLKDMGMVTEVIVANVRARVYSWKQFPCSAFNQGLFGVCLQEIWVMRIGCEVVCFSFVVCIVCVVFPAWIAGDQARITLTLF